MIADDPALLRQMLDDMESAPELYRATNFWEAHLKSLIPEIEQHGLKDFRSRPNSRLGSFGAQDVAFPMVSHNLRKARWINNRITRLIPGFLGAANKLAAEHLPIRSYIDRASFMRLAYHAACHIGRHGKPMPSMSLAGNPADVTELDGVRFSENWLHYYMAYGFAARFVDFDAIHTVAELGPGGAKQVELIRKAHPHLTFFLFDLAPQTYVQEQYLKTVFPGEVVSYLDAGKIERGKIHILGSWHFPMLADMEIDLFWNAASLQEMEPDVVGNYLTLQRAKTVFLQEKMDGSPLAAKPGSKGVLKQTTMQDYRRFLPQYDLIATEPSQFPAVIDTSYRDTIWRRR